MKATAPEADPMCADADVLRRARIALATVCEPGEVELFRALARRGPSETIAGLLARARWTQRIPRSASLGLRLAEVDVDAVIARSEDVGCRILVAGDAQWPRRVDDLGDRAPLALWCWGEANPRLLTIRSVAVVGARACSRYGEFVARDWSAQLARDGIAVISGGAYGIDAAAHRGALAVDGITICVLAGGIDIPYPRGHEGLFAEIVERGLIVSEAPPGETVRRRRFLTRNRLIAALAGATCVVEAARRSGSARTAHDAAALYRPVLAVPGPVTSETSQGTHQLVGDGLAMLAASVDDVRAAIDPIAVHPVEIDRSDGVSSTMREVLDVLPAARAFESGDRQVPGLSIPDIAVRSGIAVHEVRHQLHEAQQRGLVQQSDEARWLFVAKKRPSAAPPWRG